MIRIIDGDSVSEFVYDANGSRVLKSVSTDGSRERTVYIGSLHVSRSCGKGFRRMVDAMSLFCAISCIIGCQYGRYFVQIGLISSQSLWSLNFAGGELHTCTPVKPSTVCWVIQANLDDRAILMKDHCQADQVAQLRAPDLKTIPNRMIDVIAIKLPSDEDRSGSKE